MNLAHSFQQLSAAQMALERQAFAEAFQLYEVILADEPSMATALLGRAACHMHFNRLPEARDDLEQLLQVYPHQIEGLRALLDVSSALGIPVNPDPIRHPLSLCEKGISLAAADATRLPCPIPSEKNAQAFSLFELDNAFVVGGHRLVTTSKREVILEQQNGTFDDSYHNHQSSYWATHLARVTAGAEWLPGTYYSLVGPWSCYNFYHWTADALPQVILAEKSGFRGTYIVPTGMSFVDESLDLLGIPQSRRMKPTARALQLEHLWVSDCTAVEKLPRAPYLAYQLREQILPQVVKQSTSLKKRLLVSRGGPEHIGKRQRLIVNEVELLQRLEPYGFERVEFDLLSLREQIALAASAEAIIGAHGAGLTHTIFMPPGSLFIELFSPRYIHPGCFMPISRVMKHRYYSFLPYISTDGKYEHGHDVHANIPLIEMTVARELGR